jgi:hypothetical protein
VHRNLAEKVRVPQQRKGTSPRSRGRRVAQVDFFQRRAAPEKQVHALARQAPAEQAQLAQALAAGGQANERVDRHELAVRREIQLPPPPTRRVEAGEKVRILLVGLVCVEHPSARHSRDGAQFFVLQKLKNFVNQNSRKVGGDVQASCGNGVSRATAHGPPPPLRPRAKPVCVFRRLAWGARGGIRIMQTAAR